MPSKDRMLRFIVQSFEFQSEKLIKRDLRIFSPLFAMDVPIFDFVKQTLTQAIVFFITKFFFDELVFKFRS